MNQGPIRILTKREGPGLRQTQGLETAQATVVTNGCNDASFCTLNELNSGGTITVNDKLFDGWSAVPSPSDIQATDIRFSPDNRHAGADLGFRMIYVRLHQLRACGRVGDIVPSSPKAAIRAGNNYLR